ncbi:leucyl aminopeptidase [Haliangium ochraceum]|uniref:Probable cytosol aminopeptidase n=1 Tax=Haliangium ochraceum (strain DSM 14365 / JCM 11303 / SMP-2) TaxID=502025 RepID=D0LFL6_HALO1|nr:leucyl aminopeptidase [Haliangium ochraceum]ACY12650.1 Leucyl aminopeptidase [Haliangium ochraceum DSM 14365]
MELRYLSSAFLSTKADAAVFCVARDFADDPLFQAVDGAVGGLLGKLVRERNFVGKDIDQLSVRLDASAGLAAAHLIVLGMGARDPVSRCELRDLGARAIAAAQQLGARQVLFAAPHCEGVEPAAAVQLATEGALLGAYRFDKYRSSKRPPSSVKRFTVTVDRGDGERDAALTRSARAELERARATAEAICMARDFVNEPASYQTPSQCASDARALAKKHGLGIRVLGRKECERLGMGLYLAVARGSSEEPKFIHLTYKPKGKAKSKIALIGKGVTFDSGGYSIKTASGMEDMKIDMAGSAAVIAAMGAIASIGSEHEIHAIAACCENMVAGNAYRPGDVIRGMDGTTVEINNTDAEGRLTMADAIAYVRTKIKPDEILDFATLTGACMVALGLHTAAVMSNDAAMSQRFLAAAEAAGEDMWPLPLRPRLKDQLKSPIADLRNTGERYGGAITAGLFLAHFAKQSTWLHVDLAGPATATRARGATARGGTGFGVATIVEYLTR